MGLGLALFPALGGYVFLLLCNATRPRVQHMPGYHLVFASALAGIVFYGVSFLIAAASDLGTVQVAKAALRHATMDEHYGTVFTAAVLSLILPPVGAWTANRWVSRETADRRAAERTGRLREVILHEAMSEDRLVEISLQTGKSYVALVQKVVIGQPQSADVLLVPVLSGFRHPETRDLHITTNYFPILDRQRRRGATGDLSLGVPLSEIVSVRPFDLETWNEFHEPSRTEPGSNGGP